MGGLLLLIAAAAAVAWANSPWREAYDTLRHTVIGPAQLGLHIDLEHWASDGLLAIFFLVAGLELKREIVTGDLRDPARAVLPMAAALAGVVVPAVLYLVISAGTGAARGWAVPTATDIAFALAALAVIGSHLPSGLRSFLLTLAVVDDLIAILIIAIFFTSDLRPLLLIASLVPLALFGLLAQRRLARWWLALPLALATWGLVHASGVHATVAGIAMAMTVPARALAGETAAPAERLEHALRPLSSAFAVPVFALLAAGVTLIGGGLSQAFSSRAAWAVVVALVAGKTIGVFGGTWLTARFTRAQLDEGLAWWDVLGLALLSGIGFTVSLLLGDLAFGSQPQLRDHIKAAVLAGSLLAACLAAIVLRTRERAYRSMGDAERTVT